MSFVTKIWEWLTLFFAGIIVGIIVFIKFLDTKENEINIKKIKNKKTSGTNEVNITLQDDDKVEKKKIRLFKRKSK